MKLKRGSISIICAIVVVCIVITGAFGIAQSLNKTSATLADTYKISAAGNENNAQINEASSENNVKAEPTKNNEPEALPTATILEPIATECPAETAVSQTTEKPVSNVTAKPINKATEKPVITAAPTKAIAKLSIDSLLGQTEAQVLSSFGQPNDKELSEYGFLWYVYNSDYNRFIMLGISSGKIVGIYSNSAALSFEGLSVGNSRDSVRSTLSSKYGQPQMSIQKGLVLYMICNTDQKDVFFNGSSYTTVFYDNIVGGTLTSIQIIDKSAEQSIGYYGNPTTQLASSMERISFYLTNSSRTRMGKAILTWDDKLASVARAHSQDMYTRNYFDHTDPDGVTSSMRIKAAGISYSVFAENIAENHSSAIYAHESFMNSSGHRDNILRDTKYMGVGIYLADGAVYITQDFVIYK